MRIMLFSYSFTEIIDPLFNLICVYSRTLLLLSNLYLDVDSADLSRIEMLKKTVLELLDDDLYKTDSESVELTELFTVLTEVPSFNALSVIDRPASVASRTNAAIVVSGVALGEALRRRLLEDIGALRRISRVEGYYGADCKSLIQSGKIFYHFLFNTAISIHSKKNYVSNPSLKFIFQ